MVIGPGGDLYISDTSNNRVRKIAAGTGIITTVAGNGDNDYNGDAIPATSAAISRPDGIAFDTAGNLYVSSYLRVRKVDPVSGLVRTVAGNPDSGYNGENIPATSAVITPSSLALDAANNIYIGESCRVRKVTATTGLIRTVAGDGICRYNGDNIPAVSASLQRAGGMAFDSAGNWYIADSDRVRKISVPTGLITTAASVPCAMGVALDAAGNLYISDCTDRIFKQTAATGILTTIAGTGVSGFAGDGGPAAMAKFAFPDGLTIDPAGNLYVAEIGNSRIRKLTYQAVIILTANIAGVSFTVDNNPVAPPATLNWVPGTSHVMTAPSAVFVGTQQYVFSGWSQGGAATQTVLAPGTATAYTATYELACAYTLSHNSVAATSAGGGSLIGVTATTNCGWTAVSSAPWLTVTVGASGKGDGGVAYSIAANPYEMPRSATLTIGGQTFTVTQAGAVGAGLRYVPVTPCRVADTRNAAGPFGGPLINGGQTRDFSIPGAPAAFPLMPRRIRSMWRSCPPVRSDFSRSGLPASRRPSCPR